MWKLEGPQTPIPHQLGSRLGISSLALPECPTRRPSMPLCQRTSSGRATGCVSERRGLFCDDLRIDRGNLDGASTASALSCKMCFLSRRAVAVLGAVGNPALPVLLIQMEDKPKQNPQLESNMQPATESETRTCPCPCVVFSFAGQPESATVSSPQCFCADVF